MLLTQLNKFLGQDGYYWLCACAVFPKIEWHITLYLGNQLKNSQGNKLFHEAHLMKLVRLIWFRQSYMPDWLRLALIKSLDKKQEEFIRIAGILHRAPKVVDTF